MSLSVEQIFALAPDSASAKAGSQQASLAKWSQLGANDQALWGFCQGSGKEPYRAQIELAEPAFKCTCPSRKFPCKHGLGLYLMFAQHAKAFTEAQAPQWVSDWLHMRGQRAEKKADKLVGNEAPQTEEELAAKARSQQRRQEKRSGNMAQGLDVLDTWLADIAREGLAGMKAKSMQAWETMAARMVDAQAGGVASRIRRASALAHSSNEANWELPVARELAQIALLIQSYRRLDRLTDGLQADVRTAVGWVAAQEHALTQPAVHDIWIGCGNHTQHEERVSRRACYLRGVKSRKWAMLLQFSGGGQALPPPPLPGAMHRGSLHYYPSAVPLRAVFSSEIQALPPHEKIVGDSDAYPLGDQLLEYAQVLAANPFVEQFPMRLQAVTPQRVNSNMILRTVDGSALPVLAGFQQAWRLMALAGGKPVEVFGLWDGNSLMPLTTRVQDRLHNFDVEPGP
jgi:hypothetical protein